MKVTLPLFLLILISLPSLGQTDSTELRKPPVLSNLPIIYDRNEVAEQLAAMEKPPLQAMPVTVEMTEADSRFGNQPALRLSVPEVNLENMERSWSRFLRKEGDGKLQREGNSLFMEDIQIEQVSQDHFDAELKFDQDSLGVITDVIISADSVTFNPETDKGIYQAMEDLLIESGKEAYREKVSDDLARERNLLDDMEREMNKLVKDNEKSHKQISDNNIAINQANIEIDQNEIELKNSSQELVRNRSAVSSAADKDARKEAKKTQNRTEKTRKKLQKDREKLFQGIIDAKREIAESEQSIVKNLEDQKDLMIRMHRQTLVIEAMREKLESIN